MPVSGRSHKHARRFLYVLLGFFLFLLCCVIFLCVISGTVDNSSRRLPSYAQESLDAVLQKDEFSDGDYDFLYRQTGLGRIAVEELEHTMSRDALSDRLKEFQAALFFKGGIRHNTIVDGLCYHDLLIDEAGNTVTAPTMERKAGDVLVTSSTHTLGYAHGHAALMLRNNNMMQSTALGHPSERLSQSTETAGIGYFNQSTNFIMLRLKDEIALRLAGSYGIPADATADEVRALIADEAERDLVGVDYSLTVGVFSSKDQGKTPASTHCSHLVWQAFKNFGLDIDGDGGLVVTPRDLTLSDLFDVIQVYGFDPIQLW